MNLYLLRHGEAERHVSRDAERQLTDKGRSDLEKIGQFILQRELAIDLIVTSPYKRAQQTTTIITNSLGLSQPILTNSILEPDESPQAVIKWINTLPQQDILLVSHQPLLGLIISFLLTGHLQAPLEISPGTLVALSAEVMQAGAASLQTICAPNSLEI